ncbi:hypothetical protein CH063_15288 [Colletotrichum higginsianum]|uniref:Uncharacterized protein n=1 Tax=Colletotrichum higginsianum (strain IMI 349063) TaxID=759273 RepID=H1W267_COLHI|nr:hypothetical protein CH63R_05098 [Colletotrichum higginsianum IMI 349063]OBR12802.1 hypothetical protein CH63R_05098 [Colletotrichum higginsianum IMI 349063]CCF46580.1 hypothetical protein CH063_15288 [Colletotrichum higginsianum]
MPVRLTRCHLAHQLAKKWQGHLDSGETRRQSSRSCRRHVAEMPLMQHPQQGIPCSFTPSTYLQFWNYQVQG